MAFREICSSRGYNSSSNDFFFTEMLVTLLEHTPKNIVDVRFEHKNLIDPFSKMVAKCSVSILYPETQDFR